jgi:ankyrin repeat protein
LAAAAVGIFFVVVLVPAYRSVPATDSDRLEMFQNFETGQLGSVRAEIEYGVSPDARDSQGVPLLTRSLERCDAKAQSGDYGEFAIYLLQKGAGANVRSSDGGTPLIAAARACAPALVRTLIGAGAEVNARKDDGISALRVAKQHDRAEVAQLLLAAGARD